MGLIWNLNLGLNICLEFCASLDIYIHAIFVFAWTYYAILLAEYELMTRGAWNFMKESEIETTVRRHWVLFLLVPINIHLYIFIKCVQNLTSNKLEILFKWEE